MRRILRKSSNEFNNFGDISTLLNPEIVDKIISSFKKLINLFYSVIYFIRYFSVTSFFSRNHRI